MHIKAEKNKFTRRLAEVGTSYTFDTNGQPLFLQESQQKKALDKQYPACMKYQSSAQIYKRKANKKPPAAEAIFVRHNTNP